MLSLLVIAALAMTPVQLVFATSTMDVDGMQMRHDSMSQAANAMHMASADQDQSHNCNCCPPGACHSASAQCNAGQCGGCTISIVSPFSIQPITVTSGRILPSSLSVASLRPDNLYRPPRS